MAQIEGLSAGFRFVADHKKAGSDDVVGLHGRHRFSKMSPRQCNLPPATMEYQGADGDYAMNSQTAIEPREHLPIDAIVAIWSDCPESGAPSMLAAKVQQPRSVAGRATSMPGQPAQGGAR